MVNVDVGIDTLDPALLIIGDGDGQTNIRKRLLIHTGGFNLACSCGH
jgi:hypothetical protein